MVTRSLAPGDFSDNRRGEPRVPAHRVIDVLPCRAAKEWKFLSAELIDCSRSGLALLVTEPMEVGAQFLVKLKLAGSVTMLLYTVHNCAAWERSRHRVGARFSGLAASELTADPEKIMEALVRGE
jgi:hypothetical protein